MICRWLLNYGPIKVRVSKKNFQRLCQVGTRRLTEFVTLLIAVMAIRSQYLYVRGSDEAEAEKTYEIADMKKKRYVFGSFRHSMNLIHK